MTRQYIVGELSSLLADLQPAPGEWRAVVDGLRREIESSPLTMLPELADRGMALTDDICWAALEGGATNEFCRFADAAGALREFASNAGLLQ
jgi:hypothetical protein